MPYFVYWIITPSERFPWIAGARPPFGAVDVAPGFRLEPFASFANHERAMEELTQMRRLAGLDGSDSRTCPGRSMVNSDCGGPGDETLRQSVALDGDRPMSLRPNKGPRRTTPV